VSGGLGRAPEGFRWYGSPLSRWRGLLGPRLASLSYECCYSRGACATFCAWSRLCAAAHEVAGGGDRPVVHATVRVKGRPRLLAPAVLGGAEEPFSFFTATWHAILASSAGGWRRIALWAGGPCVDVRLAAVAISGDAMAPQRPGAGGLLIKAYCNIMNRHDYIDIP
jgi:hypothetical protein